ncbi:MAG TPA: substrate-binding domain-containing protein [Planctomycetaceae bacterium]|nr:substrate-binding domain-containing protein [Planctomycetaceae bacterium]
MKSFGRRSLYVLTSGWLAALALICSGCGGGGAGASGNAASSSADAKPAKGELKIAMLPKLTNIAYFEACHQGAEKAAKDLGVTLIYDGPTKPDGAAQNNLIETWIRHKVDAICVAPNQPKSVKGFIEKARQKGIKVLTWDSDSADSGRSLFVNQVDDPTLAAALIDDIARQMNEEGEWAIAIASLDAANLNSWRRLAEARAKEKYPKLKLVETVVTEENENVARQKIETVLNAHPDLKGILAFDSNSVPGSAEALKRSGKAGKVALTGCSSPGKMRQYLKDGVLESCYLWDPRGLGDLTVRLAVAVVKGEEIKPGMELPPHGKLRFSESDPTMVILSDPIRFTKENIDEYDWEF